MRDEAAHLKQRIMLRQISLKRQLSQPDRALLVFTNGIGHLGEWAKVDDSASVQMDQGPAADRTPALHIAARSASGASWRTEALLGRGHYRDLRGRSKIAGVTPLPLAANHQGAGLRGRGQRPGIGQRYWGVGLAGAEY